MSQTTCKLVAVVSGSDGFEECYVSFKDVVASDGALVGTPTVTSKNTELVTISGEAISSTDTVNNITHAAGELLTFRATAAKEGTNPAVPIDIVYETPKRKETFRVVVQITPYEC